MQWINVTLLLKNFLTFIVDKRPTTIKIPEFSSLPGWRSCGLTLMWLNPDDQRLKIIWMRGTSVVKLGGYHQTEEKYVTKNFYAWEYFCFPALYAGDPAHHRHCRPISAMDLPGILSPSYTHAHPSNFSFMPGSIFHRGFYPWPLAYLVFIGYKPGIGLLAAALFTDPASWLLAPQLIDCPGSFCLDYHPAWITCLK